MHFEAAKREGDILVVTLTSDRHVNRPGTPRVSAGHARRSSRRSGAWITSPLTIISCPSKRSVSSVRTCTSKAGNTQLVNDETAPIYRDKEAVESVGGRIHFTTVFTNSGEEISSNPLLNRHFSVFSEETQIFLQEFRQKYNADSILAALEKIRGLKILLIGDAVVDEYHYVRPMGKTSKANIIATRFLNEESFSGGVFACANHVAGFCDNVHVVSSLGRMDTKEEIIRSHLKPNITTKFLYREDCQTTVKRRYVDSNFLGKLFEVYYFEDQPLSEETDTVLQQYLASILPNTTSISPTTRTVFSRPRRSNFAQSRALGEHADECSEHRIQSDHKISACGFRLYRRAGVSPRDARRLALLSVARARSRSSAPRGIVTRGHKGCLVSEEGTDSVHSVFHRSRRGRRDAFFAITAPCVVADSDGTRRIHRNVVGAQAVMIAKPRIRRACRHPKPATWPKYDFQRFFQSYTSGSFFVLKTQLTGADGESQDVMSSLGDLAERSRRRMTRAEAILVGNGGSAAICSHQAFDYWKNGNIRAMSLNDPSLLTGSANDFGYPDVFAKPIEMFATPQDVIIAISSSGQSPNILNAARAGQAKGCAIVTMSAFKSDNPLRNLGDVNIYLDTMMYGYAELGHETILHTILDYHISGRHA